MSEYTSTMHKIISLSKDRFASCTGDYTVKIWKSTNTYERITSFEHNGIV